MNKIWIVLALILVIAGQVLVLSFFHEVDDYGFAANNAVITVAKWNYVDASVTLSIQPMVDNGTSNVEIVLSNGTIFNLTSSYGSMPKTFTQIFHFPRTGDFLANAAAGNEPLSLSQDKPLTVAISPDVSNVQDYISSLPLSNVQNVEIFNFIVYGEAQISVSCYGVAL